MAKDLNKEIEKSLVELVNKCNATNNDIIYSREYNDKKNWEEHIIIYEKQYQRLMGAIDIYMVINKDFNDEEFLNTFLDRINFNWKV